MAHLEVRNWTQFQHYKHRNPPWIRLYIACLDDLDFARLPDATKGQLVAIWMLAGRYHNQLPDDLGWLENKMNATHPVDWERLLSDGWITYSGDASELLARCKQNATTEQSSTEQRGNNNGADAPHPLRRRAVPSRRKVDREAWVARLSLVFGKIGVFKDAKIAAELAPVIKMLGENETVTAATYYCDHPELDKPAFFGPRGFAQKAAWCLKQVTPVSGEDAIRLVQAGR